MKKFFLYIPLLSFTCTALSSCKDKEGDYDKSKAVLAIENIDPLAIDEDLAAQAIKIPPQVNLKYYDQASYNKKIENFQFSPTKNKKNRFLSKKKQIWSGYKGLFNDRYIFEPVIHNGKIFLLDSSGILTSYDLKTKNRIYKNRIFPKRYFKNYQTPRISFHNDRIFAIAGNDQIFAINPSDGKIVWSKRILSIPISTIESDGKNIYFSTDNNKTYALNFQNGKIEWISSSFPQDTTIFGSAKPLINDNKLIISYSNGEVNCLNKNNGEILWTQNLNLNKAVNSNFYLNDIDATPRMKGNKLFVSGNGGLLMAINIDNGKFIWKKRLSSISDFWLASDFIFIINNDNKLIAMSQKDGKIKYVSELKLQKNKNKPESKIIYNGLIMAGDKLLLTNERSELVVVDPQNGEVEQTMKLRQKTYHSPIVIDGKIILHTLGKYSINLMEIW